jgi:hypothetical protein
MPVRCHKQSCNTSFKRYSTGDYAVLYNALSSYDFSFLYNEILIDATHNRLNITVMKVIVSAIPSNFKLIRKNKRAVRKVTSGELLKTSNEKKCIIYKK